MKKLRRQKLIVDGGKEKPTTERYGRIDGDDRPGVGRARAVDSFFDVFTENDYDFHSTNKLYPFDTEMLSLRLTSDPSLPRVLTPLPDGSFHVDSFFDITYQFGPIGGPYQVDSFFDVFTEMSISPPTTSPDGMRSDGETQILSMALPPTGPLGSPLVSSIADM